ncbi:WG repeat-containing protein [Chryseolinea soli]|uniref:WG repeat-containing protein n=1 Tax=Chryseolinea soli TaxID=2321403 RepID=A0A385SKZ8_9BACT|nr:WG repeat-containing protein [Chryseolinea soli]AYB30090.1 WG repeat-containing protein [Chryseolinea soli]
MKMKSFFSVLVAVALSVTAFAQTLVTQVKPAGGKKWGYADLKGDLIIPAQYEKCYQFSADGWAPIYDTDNRQYFFINTKGEKLPTELKKFKLIDGFGFDLKGFADGLVPVKDGEKWGFLNTQGKVAIPAKYDNVTDFNGGFVPVKVGDKYFILNTKGEETPVDASITDVKTFSEKLAPCRTADKKAGFLGTDGKIAIAPQFESVGYFRGGLAWAKTADKKVGYINTKGDWVIKPTFDTGKDFDPKSGMARVKDAGGWAYVSTSGNVLKVPDTDLWGDFSNGLAQGRKNGKFGFFNTKGEWVIEPQFDGSRDFVNGYAAAKKDELWGMIDASGNWVIQPKFDGIKDMELVK